MANDSGEPAVDTRQSPLICFDSFEVDLRTGELRHAGVPVMLPQHSFLILVALLQAEGEIVTKEALRKNLWPANEAGNFDRNINKAVTKLRIALGDSAEKPTFIATVRDQGYRFCISPVFKEAADDPAVTGDVFAQNGGGKDETSGVESSELATFGAFEVDLQGTEIRKRGIRIQLHQQSLKLLILLLKHQGQLLTKEDLQKQLWPPGTYVDFDSSLKKAISKLRIALEDSSEEPSFIETLSGRGYRFIAPVRYLSKSRRIASGSTPAAAGQAPNEPTRAVSAHAVSIPNRRAKLRLAFYFGSITILLGCAVAFYLHWKSPMRKNAMRPAVAVLEFKNLSGDANDAWLATALSEWTTTELAAGGELRLIPGDRVRQMEIEMTNLDADVQTQAGLSHIRRMLGTDLVISGSYRVFGAAGNQQNSDQQNNDQQIQVDLQLHDARTGKVLKVVSETGKKADLFGLISRSGQSLRSQLGVHRVTGEQTRQVAAGLPVNSEATKLYSEGLDKLRTGDGLAASDLLLQAAALDPNNAHIHDALASAWAYLGYDFNAKAEAQKAVAFVANLSREDQLLIQGRYETITANWDRAIEIYRTLFEFFPDNPDYALLLVGAQIEASRPQDALATIANLKQAPLLREDPRFDLAKARATLDGGDPKEALLITQHTIEKTSASGASLLLARAELMEGWCLTDLGALDKAIAPLSDAQARFARAGIEVGVADAIKAQAMAYDYAVDHEHAEALYEQELTISKRIGFQGGIASSLLSLGDIRLAVGDASGAKARFEEAISISQAIHDDEGFANAKINLGRVFMRLAEPIEAKKAYQESLDFFEHQGAHEWIAMNLLYLAESEFYAGKFDVALSEVNQGIEAYKKIDSKEGTGWGEIVLAEIFLNQENYVEAAATAQHAAKSLSEIKDNPGEESALALLAQSLRLQGKTAEARKKIGEARTLWNSSKDLESGLSISLNEALLQASTHNQSDQNEAETKMRNLVAETNRMQFLDFAFEARFQLASLEWQNGKKDLAVEHLKALRQDANNRGMALIASKANRFLNNQAAAIR